MKSLHRPELFSWSVFDEARNVDFHGLCIHRADGNVLIDPLPMTVHDRAHLDSLGKVVAIIVTNSDHTRAAQALASETGATLCGPAAERNNFPMPIDRWLANGDEVVPGLVAYTLDGSKTPGELAFTWQGSTLITGDLVRAHKASGLMILPDPKLANKAAAVASVRRLAELPGIEAVLVGDGWQVFRGGGTMLRELVQALG